MVVNVCYITGNGNLADDSGCLSVLPAMQEGKAVTAWAIAPTC